MSGLSGQDKLVYKVKSLNKLFPKQNTKQIGVICEKSVFRIIHSSTFELLSSLSVKPEQTMDEYDPERPYQGRPDQKMGSKIPFTGYFDPIQQRYTIENFDSDTFQTREGAEPSIVLPDKPDYIKRLEAIPFTGIESNRAAEINEYLRHNHHVTYASLQNPNGCKGQIPWQAPPAIKFREPNLALNQPQTAPAAAVRPGYMTANNPARTPSCNLNRAPPARSIAAGKLPPGTSITEVKSAGPKDPRLNRLSIAKNQLLAKTYKADANASKAASATMVRPAELASKPVHNPSMERINRHAQLAHRLVAGNLVKPVPAVQAKPIPALQVKPVVPLVPKQTAQGLQKQAGNALPAWQALQGQFCKAKADKKPKGSRNIPMKLANLTDVPANCWPLLEAQEASSNMWTSANTPPPSPPKQELEAMRALVKPVSPIAESINQDSCLLEEQPPKLSLEIQSLNQEHIPSSTIKQTTVSRGPTHQREPTVDSQTAILKKRKMSDNDSMDLDSTFIAGDKRASDDSQEAPKAKRVSMQTLASVYKARVDETQNKLVLKKGGGPLNPQPSLEGNVETEFFNEVVKVCDKPVAKSSYAAAPLITLRELMPEGVVEDAPQDFESIPLDQKFRAELIEFVVMIKPLPKPGVDPDISWEMPEANFFETIMNETFADFIESDITRMDALKWSSVATSTGVGAFSAVAEQLPLVQIFRDMLRKKVFAGHMAESFPKQTLLNNYGITLYAHGGSVA